MKSFDVEQTHAAPAKDEPSTAQRASVAEDGVVSRPILSGLAFGDQGVRAPQSVHRPVSVSGLSVSPGAQPIRRLVSLRGRYLPDRTLESPAPHKLDDDVELLISAVDDKTQQARRQVIAQPLFSKLAELAGADGHIGLWIAGVRELMQRGVYQGLMAAEFGYAVESLCTHLLGASAAGWSLQYQVAAGYTRPDIVASKAGRTVWLDLTADSSASRGHIYTSKAWHSHANCPWPHAEITYPALDDATKNVIRAAAQEEDAGSPRDSDVDPEALEAEVAAARKLHDARLANWKERFPEAIRGQVRNVRAQGPFLANKDAPARDGFIQWLNRTFGTDLNPTIDEDVRNAGSVLVALGMDPKTYGFVTNTASRARGVAFLLSNDPELLQPQATEGTVDVEMEDV